MFVPFVIASAQSWYEGFYSAALGVGVLVGEYYLLSNGYRFIKVRIKKIAANRGVNCSVTLRRNQTIHYIKPKDVSQKQKIYLEFMLFLHVLGLLLVGIAWLGLVVGLALLIQKVE